MEEKLAETIHKIWSGWMQYIFSLSKNNVDASVTIPRKLTVRWQRQMTTEYKDLTEVEKDSDRKEAQKILDIIK